MTERQTPCTPAVPWIKPADIHIFQLVDLVFYKQFGGWAAVAMGEKRTITLFDETFNGIIRQVKRIGKTETRGQGSLKMKRKGE